MTASCAITIHITRWILPLFSSYCVESAYGGGDRLWRHYSRRPASSLRQDHRSYGGSSPSRSLTPSLPPSLAEIFQKSKTCDKSGTERHTPFIQTVLVRHTMSLSIQNRAFVLRSSTKSARFCQLLWLLECRSERKKKTEKSLSHCYCLCNQCSSIVVRPVSVSIFWMK